MRRTFITAFVTAGLFGCVAVVLFYSLHLDVATPSVQETGFAPATGRNVEGLRGSGAEP